MIPFFEHGNIVDESCYNMAKLQLAYKVLNYLRTVPQMESDPGLPPLKLWYVCALDDPGCGHDMEVIPKGKSIRAIMEELLAKDEFQAVRTRLVTDDRSFEDLLSGCHLSRMISDLFEAIEKEGGA